MPTTYETLRADIITAMKARDSVTTTSLRTADAAINSSKTPTAEASEYKLYATELSRRVADATMDIDFDYYVTEVEKLCLGMKGG